MKEIAPFDPRHLSPEYETSLRANYSDEIVKSLTYDWQFALLPEQPGEVMPYVRLNEGAGAKPLIYIPGFTEGIVAKAPFAAELATLGHDVILPDQNRKKLLKDDATGKKSATYNQAVNFLAVLKAESAEAVDVVTHSYGSLIFDAMVELAERENLDLFKKANVIMLAPAGFSHETMPKLVKRLLASMQSEGKKYPKEINADDMLKAGVKTVMANVPRALREGGDLKQRSVGYHQLLDGRVASLNLLSYATDKLYPEALIQDQVTQAVEAGASWAVPISQRNVVDGAGSKPHATHNDEQFNPYRAAASVDQILRLERAA